MRVTHAETTPVIDLTDWNADHIIEGAVADDDPRLSDARTPTAHDHAYADPAHTHVLEQHNHPLEAHSHDTTHSHTSADIGAAESSHTHDLTAYATSAELTAHAETPHGGGSGVPAGVIAMWAGNVNQIPAGWNLCDGTNGTPDLTDRFIKGGTPGNTGGAATHSHAAHSGVISHAHDVSVTDPGHAHVENSNNATTGPLRGWGAADTSTNTSTATGYSTSSATTGITASASPPSGAVNELAHDSVSNEPAFYTLAFIQKS